MSASPPGMPFLDSLSLTGLGHGRILLMEFQPHSLWYEASYTIAAQAIRAGVRTDYHVFQHPPQDALDAIAEQGVDIDDARRRGLLRLLDSYTVQGGLVRPRLEKPYGFVSLSLRLSDWKKGAIDVLQDSGERDILHLDDNDSLLATANSEEEILDFFQSRAFAAVRGKHITFLHGLASGVHSEKFHRRIEAFVDGIVEFEAVEQAGRVDQVVRVRLVRGTTYDSRWRPLSVTRHGEVRVGGALSKKISTPASGATDGDSAREVAQRRLSAIMFTDMVGFTKLAQRDEAKAIRVRGEHQNLVRPFFTAHGGREVKSLGDGFLVEFPSALESVRCAIAIQSAMSRWNRPRPSAEKVLLRIGVHVGDVVRDGADLIGDSVNVASRIEPMAHPGGICVSGQVFDQVRNKLTLSLERLKAPRLKNVRVPIDVYRIILPRATAGSARPGRAVERVSKKRGARKDFRDAVGFRGSRRA